MALGSERRRLFACLFVLFMLAWGVQKVLVAGLRRSTSGSLGTVNQVVHGHIDAEILISGSSRAVYHYDPKIIEAYTGKTTFNIGRDGTRTDEQAALLRVYLRHNRKPEYLIQSLDPRALTPDGEVTDASQLIPWLNEEVFYQNAFSHRRYFWIYRQVPLVGIIRHRAVKLGLQGLFGIPDHGNNRVAGYSPQDKVWNDDFEKFHALHPNGIEYPVNPKGVNVMRDILDLCRQEGIKIILVYSPEYIEGQRVTRNRPQIISSLQSLADEFRAPFWDYSHDPISSEKDCFYNSSHLNQKGATAFSKLVGARLAREFGLHQSSATKDVTMAWPSAAAFDGSAGRVYLKEDSLGSSLSAPNVKSTANN
jgi:hypothetical protein